MPANPCLPCCYASSFGVSPSEGYDLPVFTLVGALMLCFMVIALLVKLVTDARKTARSSGGVQLEKSFFVFLIVASSFEALEAFSLFLPPS